MALFRGLVLVLAATLVEADITSPSACDLCERSDTQGPGATTLYNGDFAAFCNTCKAAKKEANVVGPAVQKEDTAKVQDTNQSPSACDLCKRPDVVGPDAGELYNTDFKAFCSSCPKEFDDGKLGLVEMPKNTKAADPMVHTIHVNGEKMAPAAFGLVFAAFLVAALAQVSRGVYTEPQYLLPTGNAVSPA